MDSGPMFLEFCEMEPGYGKYARERDMMLCIMEQASGRQKRNTHFTKSLKHIILTNKTDLARR
jgi:hypothetical protein